MCYTTGMRDKIEELIVREERGETVEQIAEALSLSAQTIKNYKRKPEYSIIKEKRELDRNNRAEMSLSQRVELMLRKVVTALETQVDQCTDDTRLIGYATKLSELSNVVGKPQNVGKMGVMVVPELLTPESFNKGDTGAADNQDAKRTRAVDPASLAIIATAPTTPTPIVPPASAKRDETIPHESPVESYPQGDLVDQMEKHLAATEHLRAYEMYRENENPAAPDSIILNPDEVGSPSNESGNNLQTMAEPLGEAKDPFDISGFMEW